MSSGCENFGLAVWPDNFGTFYLARQLVFEPVISLYLQNKKRSSVRCVWTHCDRELVPRICREFRDLLQNSAVIFALVDRDVRVALLVRKHENTAEKAYNACRDRSELSSCEWAERRREMMMFAYLLIQQQQ